MHDDALTGQVAIVTGAGSGIGRAIAVHLAARGMAVGLVSRTASDLDEVATASEEGGGAARPFAVDVRDHTEMQEVVGEVTAAFGPVDLAVHSAGTAHVIGPLWEADPDEWWGEVAVHAKGAAALARAVLPSMVERGRGRVLNVYGNLGDRGGGYCSAFACGKAGMLRFTEQVNAETSEHGVYLFAIHPGLVETATTRHLAVDEAARRWLPRFGQISDDEWDPPDDAARLVEAIARGTLDRFAGRLIGAWEDLDDQTPDGDERTLRTIEPPSYAGT